MNKSKIPDGFKQTEIGLIPEDWEIKKIQDLLDEAYLLGHLDGNHGALYPRSDEFKSFGIPYVTANELCGYKVSLNECKRLSIERASQFRKGVAKDGDVLFAHNATVGPTGILKTNLEYVILSTTATYFRCNHNKLINSFLLYYFQSSFFVSQYTMLMRQSTRNQIPITTQRKLSVILPEKIEEQKAIAKVLSDTDELIESLEQLIDKKRLIKKGAMQELLTGKRRLPGFKKSNTFKQTEIGLIPEDWNVKSLGEIAIIKDGTHQTPKYVDSGIPFYSVEQVTSNDFKHTKFITEEEHKFLTRTFKINKGDILMTRIGSIGECKVITWEVNASFYVSLALLKIQPEYSASYLAHYSKMPSFKKEVEIHSLPSAIPKKINLGPISNIKILLQPIEEQKAIAKVLSDMDSEIEALESKLSKYRQIKQGMMEKLLTGKIRLV